MHKQLTTDQEQLVRSANHRLAVRVVPATLIYVVLYGINVFTNDYYLERPLLVGTAGLLLVLIGLFRLGLYFWFQPLHDWNSRIWRLLFYIGTLSGAAIWSLAWSIAIILDGMIPTTNLAIMTTIGITAAATATLASDKRLVIYYLLLMFIPIPIAVNIHGAPEALALLIMFLIGIAFLILVAVRLNEDYWLGLTNMALLDQRAKELADARDAAVAADKAKSEFLAKMSHEIRTPMNGVLGMNELLMNTRLDERQRHLVDSIHNSGRLLLDVINDVLDFSKISAGMLELEKTPFNLREVIEQQIEMFAEPAHRKGLELISLLPGDLPSLVISDPLRLQQVLANLIGNALKFTEQGEVVIHVSTAGSTGELQEYRFEVEDTGIGVSAAAQAHIFDSFIQADGSTTRKYGGTGLGLAIAKQLAELLDGTIGLENPASGGARFWFTARLALQPHDSTSDATAKRHNRYQRILLVENYPKSRQALLAMLNLPDLITGSAGCGSEALRLLNEGSASALPYDAVIVDAGLPDMLLPAFIDAINDLQTGAVPDVLILARVNKEIDASQLQHGNCVLKRKPLRYETLLQFLEKGPAAFKPVSSLKQQTPAASASAHLPVLLAEDNLINQEVAAAMLEILGHQVVIASNGQEVLHQLEKGRFSLILIDCQMPVLDGYQATRRIRAREAQDKAGRTPIIAMTANALQDDRKTAMDAGMDDYLPKPFTLEQLEQILQTWSST